MNKYVTIFFCLVFAGTAFLASCDGGGGEQQRSVVWVDNINNGAPLFSDVLDQGDTLFVGGAPFTQDDFLTEDAVVMRFRNRPFNHLVTTAPNLPYNDFLITAYRVDYARTDGGAGVPPSYVGGLALNVPSGQSVDAVITLVPYEFKNGALLSGINYLGANFPDEIMTNATITFEGHEVGSERTWTFTTNTSVHFADPVVTTEN